MAKMIYSVAQIASTKDNIDRNIEKHIQCCRLAARHGANIIVFPEMSLTGYEQESAKDHALTRDDRRLLCLQQIAREHGMFIVAGAPVQIDAHLYIASFIFSPHAQTAIYIKKYLHPGEEIYFSKRMDYDPILTINNDTVACAICYDIENEEHVACAVEKKATAYIAGIFYATQGIQHGLKRLQAISKQHSLTVLMANYVGICWGIEGGGNSSIWSQQGERIVTSTRPVECVLLAEHLNGQWMGEEFDL